MPDLKFISDIRSKWSGLKPEHKKKVAFAIVLGFVLLLGIVGQHAKQSSIAEKKAEIEERKAINRKELSTEAKVIGKSEVADVQAHVDQLNQKVEGIETGMADIKKLVGDYAQSTKDGGKQQAPQNGNALNGNPVGIPQQQTAQKGAQAGPNKPFMTQQPPPAAFPQRPVNSPMPGVQIPPPAGAPQGQRQVATVEYVGDIDFLPGAPSNHATKDDKKKQKRTLYFPSGSFFKATIIVGGSAETVQGGKGDPEPILLRVKDTGILPNDVKARMTGCFFTGEMVGSLSKSCAKARILNFSCIDKKGNALIDAKVPGYVADETGNNCIKGDIYWKAGNIMSKTILISILGGLGNAAVSSTVPNTTTLPIGSLQTTRVPFGQAFEGGVGQSARETTDDVKKVLVQLMKETSPAVEIGTVRDVTVVVKEGTEIDIKEFSCIGGSDKCKN